jgi:hypothetical protein
MAGKAMMGPGENQIIVPLHAEQFTVERLPVVIGRRMFQSSLGACHPGRRGRSHDSRDGGSAGRGAAAWWSGGLKEEPAFAEYAKPKGIRSA